MNKFIIMVAAFSTVLFAGAMDSIVVTEHESAYFSGHLRMANRFGKQMVDEKKITKKNPIYCILNKLSADLVACDDDLEKMIAFHGLQSRIQLYKTVDSHPNVIAAKSMHLTATSEIIEKWKYLKNARIFLSGELLKEKQPNYSPVLIHEIQAADRVNFMVRNEKYPLTEDAIKDYTALFIYQLLLVPKV